MIGLVERAQKFSKRTAIISNNVEYKYDELLTKSNSIAVRLLEYKKV